MSIQFKACKRLSDPCTIIFLYLKKKKKKKKRTTS